MDDQQKLAIYKLLNELGYIRDPDAFELLPGDEDEGYNTVLDKLTDQYHVTWDDGFATYTVRGSGWLPQDKEVVVMVGDEGMDKYINDQLNYTYDKEDLINLIKVDVPGRTFSKGSRGVLEAMNHGIKEYNGYYISEALLRRGGMMFKQLERLANRLDEKGLTNEANIVDGIIEAAAPKGRGLGRRRPGQKPGGKGKRPGGGGMGRGTGPGTGPRGGTSLCPVSSLADLANRLDEKGLIQEADVVDKIIKEAGDILGPGIPDGTGPMSGTEECQQNPGNKEVVVVIPGRGMGRGPGRGPGGGMGRGMGPGSGPLGGTPLCPATDLANLANLLDEKGLTQEADMIDQILKEAAEGVAPFIHNEVKKLVDEGKTYEEVKRAIEEKYPNFEFKKEDYDEMAAGEKKEASLTKEAQTCPSCGRTLDSGGYCSECGKYPFKSADPFPGSTYSPSQSQQLGREFGK